MPAIGPGCHHAVGRQRLGELQTMHTICPQASTMRSGDVAGHLFCLPPIHLRGGSAPAPVRTRLSYSARLQPVRRWAAARSSTLTTTVSVSRHHGPGHLSQPPRPRLRLPSYSPTLLPTSPSADSELLVCGWSRIITVVISASTRPVLFAGSKEIESFAPVSCKLPSTSFARSTPACTPQIFGVGYSSRRPCSVCSHTISSTAALRHIQLVLVHASGVLC
ncbi:uncharacterized protein BDZ83DRAFT_49791 [Colletotrichum acutatum]|uniref:Uncharacterized protein n=1 Tax=Glomerella acutata TaxID=27357 RepID=A0AAD8XKY4_GLOAC|nr:uncharacterized protein BDZ83DRAFT_49791 [Colletotrichum acutatum]KAK1729291.1 hypothetical protein BDZ83DRAFT_49791 [Colletotrichum acutatum]